MRKPFFLPLLLLLSLSCSAYELKELIPISDDGTSFLVRNSISDQGDDVKGIWLVTNNFKGKKKQQSLMAYVEIDCKRHKIFQAQETIFSKPLCNGIEINSKNFPVYWSPIPPMSSFDLVHAYVCDSKLRDFANKNWTAEPAKKK